MDRELIRIAVCDDSLPDLSNTEKLLREWADREAVSDLCIEKYSDASLLYARIENGDTADIYLLDIMMGERDGIEIGRLLKKRKQEAAIIYVTSSREYAVDAYGVYAQRYLLKPVDRLELEEAMSHVMQHMEQKAEKQLALKSAEGILSVPLSRIVYAECASRTVRLYLSDQRVLQSIYIRNSFEEEIAPLLQDGSFLQIHKSFVANMQRVEVFAQDYVVMEGGDRLPISKKRIAGVKRSYLQYMADRFREGEK